MGEAKAMGAISIVNAIASGKGATVAVRLPTTARVDLEERRGSLRVLVNGRDSTQSLAVHTFRRSVRKLGYDPGRFSGVVKTNSLAPIGVGLKTSSSASVAIALATYRAFGRTSYEPRDILDCSVSASLAAGVSITGALDDAASCLLGGANFADNSRRKVLSSARLGRRLKVVVKLPGGGSRRLSVSPASIRMFSKASRYIFGAAMKGDIWKAMTLNGLLYSSIYGYPAADTLEAMEAGAAGAGLSGTGPAVAAVFEGAGSERLARAWEGAGANVIRTETSDGGAVIVE